ARGGCPRGRHQPGDHPGRRADRQPGFRVDRGDPGQLRAAQRRGPHRRAHHPRPRGRGARPPGRPPARRPGRRRPPAGAAGRQAHAGGRRPTAGRGAVIAVESIRIALRGVISSPLRSALTVLGLMIGVGAVILLVAVGNGSSVAVQRQLESLGTDTLTVTAAGPVAAGVGGLAYSGTVSRCSHLTLPDVRALGTRTAAPDIAAVAPVASTQATATYQGASASVQQFTGSTPDYLRILNYTVAAGHGF